MKKKMLSMAAAITMAVVVLTGCSSNAFSTASLAKTAEKYGMETADSYTQYMKSYLSYDKGLDTSVYYVAEDSKEALHMYDTAFAVNLGAYPAMEVKEFAACYDVRFEENSGNNVQTEIYMITANDSDSASELYDSLVGMCAPYETDSGTKNGYTYTIAFVGNENRSMAIGVYMKGNTVISISQRGDTLTDDCAGYFCKKLGLVSPFTLME
ncbi:MAG: hypothetical protein IKZ29_04805 [Clostridiales bacterium]|nr:hypothetical protein [Clostridiales bacterium]